MQSGIAEGSHLKKKHSKMKYLKCNHSTIIGNIGKINNCSKQLGKIIIRERWVGLFQEMYSLLRCSDTNWRSKEKLRAITPGEGRSRFSHVEHLRRPGLPNSQSAGRAVDVIHRLPNWLFQYNAIHTWFIYCKLLIAISTQLTINKKISGIAFSSNAFFLILGYCKAPHNPAK